MLSRHTARTALTSLALAALALSTAACTSSPEPPPPAEPVSVALPLNGIPTEPINVGLLVPPLEGEGSEYRPLVEGAGIAVYRFNLAGGKIQLVTALDDGTTAGATSAMEELLSAEVAGVVMAAGGPHTDQALQAASSAGTAVIMAYHQPVQPLEGVWSLAPSTTALAAGVGAALEKAGSNRPLLITVPDKTNTLGFTPAKTVTTAQLQTLGQTTVASFEDRSVDAVVVDAPAVEQGLVVAAIQEQLGARQLPMILTPAALTPAFSNQLVRAGTPAGWLMSVGTDCGDYTALAQGEQADNTAAFLNAVRLAAGDAGCWNVYGDDVCAASALQADIASHDATVALLRAVGLAGSANPVQVRAYLATLQTTTTDGLAGPALDFTQPAVLNDDAVVVLYASTTDPGLRPAMIPNRASGQLFWFANPGK